MSTLALTDSSGSLKESFTYDPYGNLLSRPSSLSTSFLYTGREFDEETGLYYNRARYYDPNLGRFITTDPKGYEAGLNLYTYTRNNPLSFRDPEGTDVYYGGYGYGGWGGYGYGGWGGRGFGSGGGSFVGGGFSDNGRSSGNAVGAIINGSGAGGSSGAGGGGSSSGGGGSYSGGGGGGCGSCGGGSSGGSNSAGGGGNGGGPPQPPKRDETPERRPPSEVFPPSIDIPGPLKEIGSGLAQAGRGIQGFVRNHFFRPEDAEYRVGRPGVRGFEEGKFPMTLLEDYVPTMHRFGVVHDNTVSVLTHVGVPDPIANIPTMPPAYAASVLVTSFNAIKDIIERITGRKR